MQDNSIGDEGALGLAEALKVNTALTTLGLGRNSIGAVGQGALNEMVAVRMALGDAGQVLWVGF